MGLIGACYKLSDSRDAIDAGNGEPSYCAIAIRRRGKKALLVDLGSVSGSDHDIDAIPFAMPGRVR